VTAVALEFHLEHLPRILALYALEDRPQWQYFAGFERLVPCPSPPARVGPAKFAYQPRNARPGA
jgi:hypothetical protein